MQKCDIEKQAETDPNVRAWWDSLSDAQRNEIRAMSHLPPIIPKSRVSEADIAAVASDQTRRKW